MLINVTKFNNTAATNKWIIVRKSLTLIGRIHLYNHLYDLWGIAQVVWLWITFEVPLCWYKRKLAYVEGDLQINKWKYESNFAFLFNCTLVVRTSDSMMVDEMVGAWCFGCCQAHRGLPVGFLLLQYSVLCTVESLSLPYLLFIYWFICSRRWCMDKLGVFHANQTSMRIDPHLN